MALINRIKFWIINVNSHYEVYFETVSLKQDKLYVCNSDNPPICPRG